MIRIFFVNHASLTVMINLRLPVMIKLLLEKNNDFIKLNRTEEVFGNKGI